MFSTRGIKLFSHLSAILLTTSLENIQSSNDQKNFGITHFKDIPSCYAWPHPDNSETSITSGWGCQSEVDVEYFQLLAFLQSNDSITALLHIKLQNGKTPYICGASCLRSMNIYQSLRKEKKCHEQAISSWDKSSWSE